MRNLIVCTCLAALMALPGSAQAEDPDGGSARAYFKGIEIGRSPVESAPEVGLCLVVIIRPRPERQGVVRSRIDAGPLIAQADIGSAPL